MPAAGSVLVVEDDPDLVDLLGVILRDAGYRVFTATDGFEALARVEAEMPSLILLDMRMPRMNGWEFAGEFRTRWDRSCPIVVVTAAENARLRAEEIGADGWLEKPFDLDDVVRVVQRHLGPPAAPAPAP
jgi:DNA-binding response OmpR family regulator